MRETGEMVHGVKSLMTKHETGILIPKIHVSAGLVDWAPCSLSTQEAKTKDPQGKLLPREMNDHVLGSSKRLGETNQGRHPISTSSLHTYMCPNTCQHVNTHRHMNPTQIFTQRKERDIYQW